MTIDNQNNMEHGELFNEANVSWDELTQDWQEQPYQKTDISELVKQTKRRVVVGKCCLVLDLVGTLGAIVAFIYGATLGGWKEPTLYYLGFGCIISAIFCFQTVKVRVQGWRQLKGSPDNAIANAIINCKSSIQYTQLSKYVCYLILPAANWYLFEIMSTSEKSVTPPLIFINVFLSVVWAISHYFFIKRSKELIQLKSF
ncbi:MAG: hypothetical protein ACPG46_08730 [Thalassotalea sp.]